MASSQPRSPKALPSPPSTGHGTADNPSPRLRSPATIDSLTPRKRKTPISIRHEPQYIGEQSRPLAPKSESVVMLSYDHPKTPVGLQIPLSKRAKPTPERIVQSRENATNEKPIKVVASKEKPCRSLYSENEKRSAGAESVNTSTSRATMLNGMMIDLEDGIYPEGEPPSDLHSGSVQLHDRLKKKLGQKLTPKDQRGCVYIFSDPKRPHLHKIGRTKETLKRMGQLNLSCGLQLELVGSVEVENYFRTEILIHTYISDLCRPYKCAVCNKKHGEWFEINKEPAQAYVARWVAFMNKENPYDAKSKDLHAFFRNRISLRDNLLTGPDTETIRKNWEQILSTTAADRFGYTFRSIWEVLWQFYWPINAMVAWTITFVAIQHPVMFIFMAASVIGTFVTMAHDLHDLWHDTKVSKRRRSK
ncbi:uncharacterized protein M421DRAFT_424233 [Didymella exigua CBS 183.55]|uniref:Bacteriophage T5 Orf172 DNA-binding domain-containing protein n=1 Tax=Didymella exigua CBS 183.55 TaxID=1150837 RepID=A0A6A5RD29_9PLEO|nr:uncharacterized protein M421DRAFT_424233 [Didymella exigua CBS 183.55]KAF1925004.1 hypothetical protein M421DRAFT_424233 [Didymella exigua CBS 183.55]